ncbi:hypothetical protein J1614_009578 [Plenodomus biglobosus]|nr:hypothetical protein J1614_009578 [Plenodomus biglobosus]
MLADLYPRAAGPWEAHAKYYGFGGNRGNEIYISGTWSDPVKAQGRDSGPCTAKVGAIGGTALDPGQVFDLKCSCFITGTGPLRFTSSCFLDFSVEDSNGGYAAGFSIAFECTAFNSCTGPNSYYIAPSHSKCNKEAGNICDGFRVTA